MVVHIFIFLIEIEKYETQEIIYLLKFPLHLLSLYIYHYTFNEHYSDLQLTLATVVT